MYFIQKDWNLRREYIPVVKENPHVPLFVVEFLSKADNKLSEKDYLTVCHNQAGLISYTA